MAKFFVLPSDSPVPTLANFSCSNTAVQMTSYVPLFTLTDTQATIDGSPMVNIISGIMMLQFSGSMMPYPVNLVGESQYTSRLFSGSVDMTVLAPGDTGTVDKTADGQTFTITATYNGEDITLSTTQVDGHSASIQEEKTSLVPSPIGDGYISGYASGILNVTWGIGGNEKVQFTVTLDATGSSSTTVTAAEMKYIMDGQETGSSTVTFQVVSGITVTPVSQVVNLTLNLTSGLNNSTEEV